jgi:hypothetical protein
MIAMVAADARAAPARRGPFGLGVILGEPTGFTAKGFIASPSAIQLHLGFGIGKKGRFLLAGDYLYHFHGLIPPVASAGWMSPYVGIGAHLGFAREDAVFGLRIPVGLSFQIAGAPIEVFLEIVPGVGFLPATDPLVDGGLGARWYF